MGDQHTVTGFDADLNALSALTLKMGTLALEECRDSVTALVGRDTVLAQDVVARDPILDAMQIDIEERALRLVALRQPVAIDLRRAMAAMKMASNLERCGDLAKNIAKRALVMSDAKLRSPAKGSVDRMGQLVVSRLRQVMEASRDHDIDKAEQVWRRDEEVDQQYDALFRELLTFMMGDPATITASAHLLFVAKNLERIGDHATNIAELVHYQVTGDPMPGTTRPKWDSLS